MLSIIAGMEKDSSVPDNSDGVAAKRTMDDKDIDGQDSVPRDASNDPRLSRKRTKTGCLTCRRRRIKCGEERPTCSNCIKSKRQCEGYNQRVIFKSPLNSYRGPVSSTSQTSSGLKPVTGFATETPYAHFQQNPSPSQALLPQILPKPINGRSAEGSGDSATFSVLPKSIDRPSVNQTYSDTVNGDIFFSSGINAHVESHRPSFEAQNSTVDSFQLGDQRGPVMQMPTRGDVHYNFEAVGENSSQHTLTDSHASVHGNWSFSQDHPSNEPFPEQIYQSDIRGSASAILRHSLHGQPIYIVQQIPEELNKPSSSFGQGVSFASPIKLESQMQSENYPYPLNFQPANPQAVPEDEHQPRTKLNSELPKGKTLNDQRNQYQEFETTARLVNGNLLVPIDIDNDDDDDFYDVSDEEMSIEPYNSNLETAFGQIQHDRSKNKDLGFIMALQAPQDSQDRRIRTYHSLIDGYGPETLANYYPSTRSSPLNDATTARIFRHFIEVLGPSISMYERHPANPSLIFQGNPVPRSQQHLWAYVMPSIALGNSALLHAILALASLHMAKLQNVPIIGSLRHYHIAIRRVAKSVSLPTRKGQPSTLAATLLLGFYEVMSADHNKWCNHLLGARLLLKEIDFAGMTRYLKTRKMQLRHQRNNHLYHHGMALGKLGDGFDDPGEDFQGLPENDIDESLVSIIMGKRLKYDQYGQILEEFDNDSAQEKVYTQRDLEIYNNQRDLFWWFAKQDAFQSVISQNSLFLDYDLWSHCPPRAPIGRRDAVYGSFDHMILLLGRLANFAAKDIKRKHKVMQANGGQWRPPPGLRIPPPPPGPPGASQGAKSHGPPRQQSGPPKMTMPPFHGMLPGTGRATLPRGFSPTRETSPASDEDDSPLEDQTAAAEEEWHEIRSAFDMIADAFGFEFQPLGPEYSQPIPSPFGPAIQYRTYSIAGIWLAYYHGLIICHRAHPSMPPAAVIATGIAASQTASFANTIGRIAAGIAPEASNLSTVNVGTGAGMMESAFSLFVAGVQLQDHTQRTWTIKRLLDIERLTGWQTASQVAKGCETSWIRAAEMGRGPPWTAYADITTAPESKIWQSAGIRIETMMSERGESHKDARALADRAQFAVGLIGLARDLDQLKVESNGDDDNGENRR